MKRTNKFRYNKENITSRLFAQNRKRRSSHYDDEEEEEDYRGGGGMGAGAAVGLGAAGLGIASQGLSALGTIQGVHEQGKGIKGWFDQNKRRKEDYKKYGGDERLMEKKRDQAFRLSKNAKNSAQEAALRQRESEISDSLNYARKQNAYKNDMAKQKSWVGKGTTWAKHNPMKAGLAAAGVAAAAGGAYYMWKKRQEEKKRREREKREREGGYRTRHQSKITSRLFSYGRVGKRGYGAAASRVLGKSKSIKPTSTIGHYQPKVKPKPHVMDMYTKSKTSTTPATTNPSNHWKTNETTNNISHHTSSTTPLTNHNLANVKANRNKKRLERLNQKKQNLINDAKSGSYNAMSKERAAEIKQRQIDKQNDQARRDKTQEKLRERKLGHQEKNIQNLAKQAEELKTADSGVWSHNYNQKQKELRNARIEHHNTKFEGDKIGDLKERALGFKKFDKNGNLRWGKKRLAAGALGAYAAYNMMKDDDDDK